MKRDWTGHKFWKLLVLNDSGLRDYKSHVLWRCRCDCGKEVMIASKNLINDNIQSCGCSRKEPPADLTGQTFGLLAVIKKDKQQVYAAGHPFWECVCECGNKISVPAHRLYFHLMQDCGCKKKTTCKTNMHQRWKSMISRCYDTANINYARYGGRGIKVCNRWHFSFEAFYKDMGNPPSRRSLGRKDNDGDYCPSNVRWETEKTQQNNRCNNHYITANKEKKTISQWSDDLGLNVSQRLASGWDEITAVTAPPGMTYVGARMKYDELDFT